MKTPHQFNRRSFLKGSLLTTAALATPARFWAAVPGANDDIRVAVVGFHGRGGDHIKGFSKIPGVRIVALCDCDSHVLQNEVQQQKKKGNNVQAYTDVRKLLENKDVDAISTATPNHWHSLITIWGCQAGKDVYVEKPVSHNISEGRRSWKPPADTTALCRPARKAAPSRCYPEAWAWIREGRIGKIKIARGLCYKPRESIGKVDGPQPIPEDIDYDLWCGPALKLPLRRKRLHYDWHWVWNTGNGDMGNQGIHEMDKSRWFGQMESCPPASSAIGGRLGYIDDGETPNTQMCVLQLRRCAPHL